MKKIGRISGICIVTVCLTMAIFGGCQGEKQAENQKTQSDINNQNQSSTPEKLAAQSEGKDEDGSELPEIIIGCDKYPPFNYIGTDGQPTGLDVDLATEAFKRAGYQVQFEFIDWSNKKQLLEDGQIDCIWCCFSMNDREDEYRWVGPYMMSRQVIAVMPDSDIYDISDLENRRVALQVTTKPEEIFLENEDKWHIKELFSLQNRELIYAFLSKGYVDAVAAHEASVLQYMADFNVEYRILDEPLQIVGLGVAFANADERGIDELLRSSLVEMQNDGTTARMIQHYFKDVDKYFPDELTISEDNLAYSEVNEYGE